MVWPYQSAQFGDIDLSGNVVHFDQTDLFKKDLVGLKSLYDNNRVSFIHVEDIHLFYEWDHAFDVVDFIFSADYVNKKQHNCADI